MSKKRTKTTGTGAKTTHTRSKSVQNRKNVTQNGKSVTLSQRNDSYEKVDSWENTITGLGVINKDKRTGSVPTYIRLEEPEVEELYAADDVAKRITDRLPYDMTRKWFEITGPDISPEMSADIIGYLDQFNIRKKIRQGLSWGRQYGGAGLIIGVTGFNSNSREPLIPSAANKLEFITVLNRYELIAQNPVNGDVTSPNFRLPEKYMISPRGVTSQESTGTMVHWSRVIRFEGDELPARLFSENNYWHASVYSRLFNALRNFQGAHDSLAVLMQEFSQAIYKIKDLADIVASKNGSEMIQRRINIVDMCRSILNAVLIGDDEEFERKTIPLTGVDDVMRIINNRLVAATDMPHTVLLGESPSGLGATGESEQANWFEFVSGQQEEHLRPILERMLSVVFNLKGGPTNGREPEGWEIKFHPLHVPSESQIVETRNKQADTDKKYIESGVLTPDEVAESRFGGDEYSIETKLSVARNPSVDPMTEGDDEDDMTGGVENE